MHRPLATVPCPILHQPVKPVFKSKRRSPKCRCPYCSSLSAKVRIKNMYISNHHNINRTNRNKIISFHWKKFNVNEIYRRLCADSDLGWFLHFSLFCNHRYRVAKLHINLIFLLKNITFKNKLQKYITVNYKKALFDLSKTHALIKKFCPICTAPVSAGFLHR